MKPEILIIDSEALTRFSLASRLRQEGYQVREAEGRVEAEQTVRDRDIRVALLDLRGLDDDALRLVQGIKSSSPETEIILLTSRDKIALSIQGMKMGCFDDLMAPYDTSVLLTRVRDAWDNRGGKPVRARTRDRVPKTLVRFVETVGLTGARMLYGEYPVPSLEFSTAGR